MEIIQLDLFGNENKLTYIKKLDNEIKNKEEIIKLLNSKEKKLYFLNRNKKELDDKCDYGFLKTLNDTQINVIKKEITLLKWVLNID